MDDPEGDTNQQALLAALQQELAGSGVEFAADAATIPMPGSRGFGIALDAGRFAVVARIEEKVPGRIHVHVLSIIGSTLVPDVTTFDACVVGVGEPFQEAVRDAARSWLRQAFAPQASLLLARPVLAADHFEGHEPWGVPGRHGFVGPVALRGELPANAADFATAPIFRDARLPTDRKPHLAKAVVTWLNGTWTRVIEIDGHRAVQTDRNFDLAAPTASVGLIVTRFAVFFAARRNPSWLARAATALFGKS